MLAEQADQADGSASYCIVVHNPAVLCMSSATASLCKRQPTIVTLLVQAISAQHKVLLESHTVDPLKHPILVSLRNK
jgi:hypothetical protein